MEESAVLIELMPYTEDHLCHKVRWNGGAPQGFWHYFEDTEEFEIVFSARADGTPKRHVFRRVPSSRTWILDGGNHNNKPSATVLLIQKE